MFLDACFSGGARNGYLQSSRGIKVKPKEEVLNGNIVIFSATSAEQAAMAYNEMKHGMFTYYLLKKLQESKGNLTYIELAEYLSIQVAIKSALVNDCQQIPQISVSPLISESWKVWNFKK